MSSEPYGLDDHQENTTGSISDRKQPLPARRQDSTSTDTSTSMSTCRLPENGEMPLHGFELATFEALGNEYVTEQDTDDYKREALAQEKRRLSSIRLHTTGINELLDEDKEQIALGSDALMLSFKNLKSDEQQNEKQDSKKKKNNILKMKTVAKIIAEDGAEVEEGNKLTGDQEGYHLLDADTMKVSSKGFFKQWCWRVPKSRILLEVMAASGENRVGSVGVSETARDWVVPLLYIITLALFIGVEAKVADYRHVCVTPCGGECDYQGNPTRDPIPDHHPKCKIPPNQFGQLRDTETAVEHIFEPIKLSTANVEVLLSLILRAGGKGVHDSCHPNVTATVQDPSGQFHVEQLDIKHCEEVSHDLCAILLYSSQIGSNREGQWVFSVSHSSCGEDVPLLAEAVVFYGNRHWFYVETVVRYTSFVLICIGVVAMFLRLWRRINAKQPHIATGRFVFGVTPFLLLMLNPLYLPSVLVGSDHWIYAIVDDIGPRWFIAAMATFILSLIANTNLITDVPTLLDVRVYSLQQRLFMGGRDKPPPVSVEVKLRRDPRYHVSKRDLYEAYSMCAEITNRRPIDDVISFIKSHKDIREMLQLSKHRDWEGSLKAECRESTILSPGFLAEVWPNIVTAKQLERIRFPEGTAKFTQDVTNATNAATFVLDHIKETADIESGSLQQGPTPVEQAIQVLQNNHNVVGKLHLDKFTDWKTEFRCALSDELTQIAFVDAWRRLSTNRVLKDVSNKIDEYLALMEKDTKLRHNKMLDKVIEFIEHDEQLRNLLNVDNLPGNGKKNWKAAFRSRCGVQSEKESTLPEKLRKSDFIRVWNSLNMAEEASDFISSQSQSWSIFQFALDDLNLNRDDTLTIGIRIEYDPCKPLRGTLATPRTTISEDQDRILDYKWITLSPTALRGTLHQEVLLPTPEFTTGNELAITADVAAAAALVLVVESFGPEIEVGVSGWLPAERDSSLQSLVQTSSVVVSVLVGIFLGASDVFVLAQREWKRYVPGDFSGKREAVLFASSNSWAEDTRETIIIFWFITMIAFTVRSGRKLKRLGYRHARYQHLLYHMVRMVIVGVVIVALIIFQFAKPVRHVENFRRRWDTMSFIGLGVPLYACFAVAVCPPIVPRTLDPGDLNEENYIAYLQDTGGSRLRYVKTIQEKEILLQAMQDAKRREKREIASEPGSDAENNCPDFDEVSQEPSTVSTRRREMQRTFCIETAVNCFHCSTLAYESISPFEENQMEGEEEKGCHERQDLQLSHDYPVAPKLLIDGRTRPSLYHYYYSQLLMCESPKDAKKVLQASTAAEAKQTYHKLMDHRHNNDDIDDDTRNCKKPICLPRQQKEALILKCLWAKYEQSAECRAALLSTRSRVLEKRYFDDIPTSDMLSMIRRNCNDVLYIQKDLAEWRRELTAEKIITYSRKSDDEIYEWVSEIDGRKEEMQHTVINKLSAALFQLKQRDTERKQGAKLKLRDSEKELDKMSAIDKLKSNITRTKERRTSFESTLGISYRRHKDVRSEEEVESVVRRNSFREIHKVLQEETDTEFQKEVLSAIFSHCHKENISLCVTSIVSAVFATDERGVQLISEDQDMIKYNKIASGASENTLISLYEEFETKSCDAFVPSEHKLATLVKEARNSFKGSSRLRKFLEELTMRSLQLDCESDSLDTNERTSILRAWGDVGRGMSIVWRTFLDAMHLSTSPTPFSKVLLRTGRKTLVDTNYQPGQLNPSIGTGIPENPAVIVQCSENDVPISEEYINSVMTIADVEEIRNLFKDMLVRIIEYNHHQSHKEPLPKCQCLLDNVNTYTRILNLCQLQVVEKELQAYISKADKKHQNPIISKEKFTKWTKSNKLIRKSTRKMICFESAFREYIVEVSVKSMKDSNSTMKLELVDEWLLIYNDALDDEITVYNLIQKNLPVANSKALLKLGLADLKNATPCRDPVTEALMMIREALQRKPRENKISVEKKFGWLKKAGYTLKHKFFSNEKNEPKMCPSGLCCSSKESDDFDDNFPGQTTCWILEKGNTYYVSFRGTILMQQGKTDLRNALTDITCCKAQMEIPNEDPVGVHKGFFQLWQNLKKEMKHIMNDNPEIKEIFYPESPDNVSPLVFTGHSLGGALATLAALDFATDKKVNVERNIIVYNFGCPRVGNSAFVKLCEKYVPESYRIVNKGDMISILPPNLANYKHAGHPVTLNSTGEFLVSGTFAERNILPYFQPSFIYRPHAHRRGGDGGNGYGTAIRRMAGNNNLRDRGEILFALRSGSRYSPEFRNLWSSQVSSLEPSDHHKSVFLKEAVRVCEEPPQVALSIPIVVYYCQLRTNTLVAASNKTRNWAIAHGYRQVCELGQVFTHPRGDGMSHSRSNLEPLYLYYNSKRRDHMLCASINACRDAESKNYVRRSLEGYVYPSDALIPSIATIPVTSTWRPKLQDHSVNEANKYLPDSGNTIEVLSREFLILEKPRVPFVQKFWATVGYLPVSLFAGLVTVAIGKRRDAPLVALITAATVFSFGFILTISVQIVRFPRAMDIAYIIVYGLLYISTHHLNISFVDTDELIVPLLLATHSTAVLGTVVSDRPFNEDNWQEDGSIPRGIAKKPEFAFIVRIYANTHLVASLFAAMLAFIPALMSKSELKSDYNELFSAIGSIVYFLLVHLFHHAMVFYCLKFLTTSNIGESIGATEGKYKLSRYVDDFCQLFPEVPSVITGQFTIRDNDVTFELPHVLRGKQITHEERTDNDALYENELSDLFEYVVLFIVT